MPAVTIATDEARLPADLTVPAEPVGVVAFAHGSGSSRHSPRSRLVAARLAERGLATLLLDLLTSDEEQADRASGALRFNIALLSGRFVAAIDWLATEPSTEQLLVGCFGASTGAAAALIAAACRSSAVRAVVSRGGRPDLAGEQLTAVTAPTLLIVGGADPAVLDLNRQARELLRCESELQVIEGAGHLFEQPGTLERVAELAGDWFVEHLHDESDRGR